MDYPSKPEGCCAGSVKLSGYAGLGGC